MKKFLNEFKEFAMRGNVIDLAVGVIIGAAFQAIVKSLVDDVISPVIGLLVKTDFNDLALKLGVNEAGEEILLKYGAFITNVINFVIMAFIIFIMVKAINKVTSLGKKQEEVAQEATTKVCPYCCSEIDIKATKCPNCTSDIEVE